jgi:hypothetical protein
MSKIIKITGWAGKPRASIIFVHGLGGHAYDTWRRAPNDGSFWPLWLAEDVVGVTVYTLAYEAPPSNWLGTAMPLQDRAVNVLECLLDMPELTEAPVIFICHSLGGLIVKQILLDLHQQKDRRHEAAALLECVVEVIFLATPHTGSRQASLLDRFRFLAWPSSITKMLVANDPSLRAVNVGYRGLAEERGNVLRHLIFYETGGTQAGLIVEEASADPGLPGRPPLSIDADHVSIAKPADRSSLLYRRTRGRLWEILGRLEAGSGFEAHPLPDLKREQPWNVAPKLIRLTLLAIAVLIVFKGVQALVTPSVPQHLEQKVDETNDLIRQLITRIRLKVRFPELSDEAIVTGSKAEVSFRSKKYSETAIKFELAADLSSSPDAQRYFSGMATASYYGSGNHRGGLKYLCHLYSALPRTDNRFRHSVHAHLRTIAFQEGYQTALAVIDSLKQEKHCDRDDITPIWLGIPLEIMRSLENGKFINDPAAVLSDEDKSFLQNLLTQFPELPFQDYALYALGKTEEAYSRFPKSYIQDVLLFSRAKTEPISQRIQFLEEYIAKYKNRPNYKNAVDMLIRSYTSVQRFEDADQLMKTEGGVFFRFFGISKDHGINTYLNNAADEIVELNNAGFFGELAAKYNEIDYNLKLLVGEDYLLKRSLLYFWDFAAFGNHEVYLNTHTIQYAKRFYEHTQWALEKKAYNDIFDIGRILKRCGDARHGININKMDAEVCQKLSATLPSDARFHEAAEVLFSYLSSSSADESIRSRANFLAALSYKRQGKFAEYADQLRYYIDNFQNSHLFDDALTELGWYHLAILEDPTSAKRYLGRVLDLCPGRNACDNALNWLAITELHSGNIISFARLQTELLLTVTSDRLRRKVVDRYVDEQFYYDGLRKGKWKGSVTLLTIFVSEFWAHDIDDGRVKVTFVDPNSEAYRLGFREGMVILRLNGREMHNVTEFFSELFSCENGDEVIVNINNDMDYKMIKFSVGML